MKILLAFFLGWLSISCVPKEKKEIPELMQNQEAAVPSEKINKYEDYSDTAFVNLKDYAQGFAYDMRYALDDNFLKKKVYECDNCLIRKEVADALIRANDTLRTYGYRIRFFDCYRPIDVQKQMWQIYPDARYVANPNTSGSIHNRGGAVDITLEDLKGNVVDMGTDFDHFDIEAHHSYTNLPEAVLRHRNLLKSIMESTGFKSIKTEWWHYNFKSNSGYALSNFKIECEE